jgi:cold shock protein
MDGSHGHIDPSTAMTTGRVRWFSETKNYGFIAPDEGGAHVFMHISAVERAGLETLREGQKVSFDVVADVRGTGQGRKHAVGLILA